MKRIVKDDKGQALVLTLITLAVGTLLITPFLNSVGDKLLTSRKYRASVAEEYALDASVEDALWNVVYGDFGSTALNIPGDTTSYSLDGPVNEIAPSIDITRDRVDLADDDLESGGWAGGSGWVNDWYHDGDSSLVTTGSPYEGTYHLRLRSSTGYVKRAVDTSGQSSMRLQFWAKVESFEPSDEAELQVSSDGTVWTTVKSWTNADSDNVYHFVDIDLSPYAVSAEFWFAFDAAMSAENDQLFIDQLTVVRMFSGAVLDLPTDDFESGGFSGGTDWLYDWYTDGAVSATTSEAPQEGNYHVEMTRSNSYMKRAADLSGQSGLHLMFWAKANSFEVGDYMECLVSPDDTNWTTANTWTSADSDNTYHFVDIDLSPYTMSSEFWIAFDSGMDSKNDYFYIDGLRIVDAIAYEIVVTASDVTIQANVTVKGGDVTILSWQRD